MTLVKSNAIIIKFRALCYQVYGISKKLVSISATSAPITKASKEDEVVLKRVSCIYNPLYFQKDIVKVKALINSSSKVNTITPAYVLELGLKVRLTDIGA